MIALACDCKEYSKAGKDRKGQQRFVCKSCKRRWTEQRAKPIGDMRIELDRAALAIQLLVEGNSIRSTSRITKLHPDTIGNLILTVGENCERFLSDTIRDMSVRFVEADEVWSFIGMKDATRKKLGYSDEFGDSWTWVGFDRETKLVLAHHVGSREAEDAQKFADKLRSAIKGRFQLTTDGLGSYTNTVPLTFRYDVDFAQLIKNYEKEQETIRYSPPKIRSIEKVARFGNPDMEMVSTSFVENFNLQFRMGMRRFTRLTNAFSKSLEHHVAMQNIWIAAYNFCRKHGTLKESPAAASGLTLEIWSIDRLLKEAANNG